MEGDTFPGTEERAAQPVQPRGRQRGGIYGWSLRTTLRVLRISNWVNAAVIVGVYPLGLFTSIVSTTASIAYIFLMAYCIIFGLVLLCFECHLEATERVLRQYFGFLFSYIGRSLFIAFVATICFGAYNVLGYIVGAGTLANAVFNFVIIFSHPAFTAGKVRGGSRDPTRGYSRGGVEAARAAKHVYAENKDVAHRAARSAVTAGAQYARDNPDVARQAAGAAVSYARDNPDVAREVASAAVSSGGGGGGGGRGGGSKTSDGFDVSQL